MVLSSPSSHQDDEVIVAGHSHTLALGVPKPKGEESRLVLLRERPIRILAFRARSGLQIDETYWREVAAVAQQKTVAISWLGNQHNSAFFFARAPAFDLVTDEPGVALQPRIVLVPTSVFRRLFAPTLVPLVEMIALLRSAGVGNIIILGTPPPKGEGPALISCIGTSAKFMKLANRAGIDPAKPGTITPDSVRLKLWRVLQHMMAETAAQQGALFVPVPADCQDQHGMLRPEYWALDVTHANDLYGEQVLDGLAGMISEEAGRL